MEHQHYPHSLARLQEINKSLTVREANGPSLLKPLLRLLPTQSHAEKLHFTGSKGGRQM